MLDIVLELFRALILLGIFVFLLNAGGNRFESHRTGWTLIVTGFGLLLFGSVLDITDNFESLNRFVVIGDTDVESFLEKFVGFLGGFVFIAVGLVKWIPSVHQLSDLIQERTSELTDINKTLLAEKAQVDSTDKALRLSETRSRAVVDNIIDGIITVDEAGIIQSANLALGRIFGQSPHYFVGKSASSLATSDARTDFDKYFEGISKQQNSAPNTAWYEMPGITLSGQNIMLELAFSEVGSIDQKLYVGIVRDVTERNEMDRVKSEFVSLVSHELRTPLTSIHGSLGLVCGGSIGSIPGRAKEMVDLAQKNTTRLINLINDILDIEKLESGGMDFEFANTNMGELARKAIELNNGYGLEYGVQFSMSELGSNTIVLGDPDRLMQVLTNLMSNAAKFSPTGKDVEITVREFDRSVRLSVKDQGFGIPHEHRDRIFGKFVQVKSDSTREVGGTGLGLSISKAIVSAHQGEIWFESEVGHGTTFHVDLPMGDVSIN